MRSNSFHRNTTNKQRCQTADNRTRTLFFSDVVKMALESDVTTKNDNEEEDIGCFFLQPSSSPYNITEKVQQANFDLFNSTPQTSRSTKVKFRDDLISFEPDLTDDDVNSIESDQVADDLPIILDSECQEIRDEETKLSYNTVLMAGMDIYDIEEEIDETVLEELVLSDENEPNNFNENENSDPEAKPTQPLDENEATPEESSKRSKVNSETVTISSRKTTKRKKHSSKTIRKQEVHCKEHCIERIDTHLSMSIKKLEIHEKPLVSLPPLQLHQRKCCDEIKLSNSDRNLPNYKGYRSEYGLSSRQIKNRDRYMEMIRQKEMARQKLIEDYRTLKVQQNEEVFCQWLREVTRRNKVQSLRNQLSRYGNKSVSSNYSSDAQNYSSPKVVNINKTGKVKERPKTAGFVPKTNIKKKKRPHTTQSCVYIELSPNVLKRGIHIGDLLITNSKELSKKLQILTVS